jgi:hypothetical protein
MGFGTIIELEDGTVTSVDMHSMKFETFNPVLNPTPAMIARAAKRPPYPF